MEDEVIADIARRVKKTGRYTETAELMAKSMVEQGYSAEKIQAEVMKMLRADKAYQMAVAENTKAYKQEIQDIIDKTVAEAKEAGDALIAEAGNMAWNNDLSMWKQHGVDLKKPNTMSQMINAFQLQTAGQLKNLTKTMGFKNTIFGTTGILNAYQREMDLALLKVATGTFSYDQAVNDCVKRLAQSGLRSIDYANGRSYQLDTAARMCVRTGMSQLAGKVMEANLKSTGQDLVITSQHMGSRPEHVPWQNKVFSYSGKNKKYPDFFKETGYGTATGLKGVNCTHDFYPFWEGASVIPEDIKEPKPVKVNGKEYTYYQANQQQRKMERDIRATKREIEAQKAIGGDTTELQSKLRGQTAAYKKFSADAGLKAKQNRLRVVGGSSNVTLAKSQKRTKIVSRKTITHSETYNQLKNTLDKLGVAYNPVKNSTKKLTNDEIIKILSGGDKTSGSCASLGLAYIGQKNGLNVLDFRGGESQSFFSTKWNLDQIMKFAPQESVKTSVARSYITSGNKLLKEVESGKEYYFYCGRHAAIVRKNADGILQYLELQSSNNSGWTNFNGNPRYTLATRFGCDNTAGMDVSGVLVDIEAFKNSDDFNSILGYINTESDKQKKGAGGYAK